jgi:hypothetical protein
MGDLMNTIDPRDALAAAEQLSADGEPALESDWRLVVRHNLHARGDTYGDRVCDWAIESGAVERRVNSSVAVNPTKMQALRDLTHTPPRDGAK